MTTATTKYKLERFSIFLPVSPDSSTNANNADVPHYAYCRMKVTLSIDWLANSG